MKYNGWTNYQTWSCYIWIDGNDLMKNKMIEQASSSSDELTDLLEDSLRESIDELTDLLEDSLRESIPEGTKAIYFNLAQSAINLINFREIAERLLE